MSDELPKAAGPVQLAAPRSLKWTILRVSRRYKDAFTLSFASISVLVSAYAAVVATSALSTARNNFRADQRPYVWAPNDLGAPAWVQGATGQIVWSWRYTNYGKSPAYKLRIASLIKIADGAFEPSYGSTGEKPGPPLPPNKVDFGSTVSKPGINREEFVALSSKDNAISIRVILKYEDSYRTPYETVLCLSKLASSAIMYCEGSDIK